MQPYDIAIIGAGPIGLETHIACQKAGMSVLHLDKGQIGQTISWFPPLMRFFSSNERIAIAGVPIQTTDQSKCTREDYLGYLRGLVIQFNLPIQTFEPVTQVTKENNLFTIQSDRFGQEATYQARNVVMATGGTAWPRKLNIPGEEFDHVHRQFDDPHKYFQRKLMIIGGKNSAVEAALRCHQAFAKVTMSYRKKDFNSSSIKYWLLPEMKSRIKAHEITCHFETIPVAIYRDSVALKHLRTGETFEVPVDNVLISIGFEADMSLFKKVGIPLEGEGKIPQFDPSTMQTHIDGLYIAGTAVAGTQQSYQVFLENCHVHVDRIVASITGTPLPEAPKINDDLET